jgi:hypothetical protein
MSEGDHTLDNQRIINRELLNAEYDSKRTSLLVQGAVTQLGSLLDLEELERVLKAVLEDRKRRCKSTTE